MTKSEFFDLLEKFEKGTCSTSEVKLLKHYCEKAQTKEESLWQLSNKEAVKIRLFKRILKTIEDQKPKQQSIGKRRYWSIAAVFIILLGSGVLLKQFFGEGEHRVFTEDQITLELPNGELKVIEKSDSNYSLTSNGSVHKLNNSQTLIYHESENSKAVEYHTLNVPYGKTFKLQLADGSKVHLNAGSSIKYPSQFREGKNREVTLKGEAFFEVAHDSLHPFLVNADHLQISVLGTKFNVQSYIEDKTTDVVLVEGAVALSPNEISDTKGRFILSPGEMGSIMKDNNRIAITETTPDIYISWMEGRLVFREISFNNMIKKLERHYDKTIINNNELLAKEKFSASFGKIEVTKLFESLKKYHGINYTASGDTIYIN
ncbi:FecR family protein [Zunongwangia sp. HGR-M22]|uniref:FecR family protein n=1 Tax=Zunongwangia sp. HGR-M22 TaxID=3015168 RepID=UPI0022DE563B|nr:FecR domain-containing protein [Zunongwangia sp. HGR-M22]WBL27021.1 FecR domain-containing protein [Zunongwangia sp. HGR-M22]